MIVINNIKIINNDVMEVMKNIPNESIDLVVTDPPYKVTARGSSGGTGGMLTKDINKKGKVFTYNNIEIKDWLPQIYRILKNGGHGYIMSNNKNLKEYLNVIEEVGFSIFKTLVWDKGNAITNMYYMDSHEYIIFFRKGKANRINNCGTKSILKIPNKKLKGENGKNLHDTEKPIELMKILIENSSQENDIVFEPFMGIGSTALACIELNRNCIAVEIDENYYDIGLNRINTYIKENDLKDKVNILNT